MDRLLVSKSGQAAGRVKSAVFGLTGAYLIAITAWRYFAYGITSGAQYTIFVGVLSFFVISYSKRVYLSSSGVVRETRTWRTSHCEVMRWDEIKAVSIVYRGKEAMAFLERDAMGWKALFGRDQVPELKAIFAKYIPDIDIDEVDG